MNGMVRVLSVVACMAFTSVLGIASSADTPAGTVRVRVATYNVEDLRTENINDPTDEKATAIARLIQHVRPDIIFINEIQYDESSADDASVAEAHVGGTNAQRFADTFLAKSQGDGLEPLKYTAYMAPSNTGMPSGLDLDNNGKVGEAGSGRDYGGDCLGYGEFPGQYAMALLVRSDWTIRADQVRTFRTFKWRDMPDAQLPPAEDGTKGAWYTDGELAIFPLSSKSHWDVPVQLGTQIEAPVIHVLCSHPTPPVFDGLEDRNGRRNHDEIRFWADYLADASYIIDDDGAGGGLSEGNSFVIVGDLNADPDRGNSRGNPIREYLLNNPRVRPTDPVSRTSFEDLLPSDTSRFKLRVDYVLPSKDMTPMASGIVRGPADVDPSLAPGMVAWNGHFESPSDHFAVWVDLAVPLTAGKSNPPADRTP